MKSWLSVSIVVALGTALGTGCTARGSVVPAAVASAPGHAHDPSGHNHDRGSMMIASNGVVDALLTSHLSSKSGNELDVFVEKDGTPLALTTTRLSAKAHLRGGPDKSLVFDCAPADERPEDEVEGTCSHFVARAGWMTRDDRLEVATALPLRSGDVAYTWRAFDPVRYAHHIE